MKPWTTPLLATLLASGCGAPAPAVQEGDRIHGRVFVSWSLERLSDKDPIHEAGPVECSSIGADIVFFRATGELTGDVIVARFDCTDVGGSTEIRIADTYDSELYLLDCKSSPDCTDPILLAEGEPIHFDALTADASVHIDPVRFVIQ